jgi:hypothetical protein
MSNQLMPQNRERTIDVLARDNRGFRVTSVTKCGWSVTKYG